MIKVIVMIILMIIISMIIIMMIIIMMIMIIINIMQYVALPWVDRWSQCTWGSICDVGLGQVQGKIIASQPIHLWEYCKSVVMQMHLFCRIAFLYIHR